MQVPSLRNERIARKGQGTFHNTVLSRPMLCAFACPMLRWPAPPQRLDRYFGKKARRTAEPGAALNVALWANVSHTHDCGLDLHAVQGGDFNGSPRDIRPHLGLHIVVQNFGAEPVRVRPEDVRLHLKSEAILTPTLGALHRIPSGDLASAPRSVGSILALGRRGELVDYVPSDEAELGQWDFAVRPKRSSSQLPAAGGRVDGGGDFSALLSTNGMRAPADFWGVPLPDAGRRVSRAARARGLRGDLSPRPGVSACMFQPQPC